MKKKILIGLGVFVLLFFGTLLAAPFLFKDKIQAFVLQSINDNLNAKVNLSKVDISLIKNFPRATVKINDLSVINLAPFEGDTLFYSQNLELKMSVMELFKKEGEAMEVKSVVADNALVQILFNKDGIGNYDIAIKKEEEQPEATPSAFQMKIQEYAIKNSRFVFNNAQSNMRMELFDIQHQGKGDFTAKQLDLDTKTTTNLSFNMNGTSFASRLPLALDAVIGMDMENQKYTFKQNQALVRQLVLQLDGSLQLLEEGQQYDLTFKTPSSSFQNFLALVPSAYSGSLDKVKTSGNFEVNGKVKGKLTETTIPTLDITLKANNASFQFPELPKKVEQILLDTRIQNQTGLPKDTYVDLNQLQFKIDQDVFKAKANVKNLSENALVDAMLQGTLNLGNLNKAYPMPLEKPLSGTLFADVTTKFDMQSVENGNYQNIQNQGSLKLQNFTYTDEQGKGMQISEAAIAFNPSVLKLEKFVAKTGASDINASGTLDNFYGFLFRNQNLQGNFQLQSNQIKVSDFMTADAAGTEKKASTEALKIPAFLDCSITANAKTVLYDNLTLKNVSGKLLIKDETVTLQNVKTDIFGGQIAFNGAVSTKNETPTFNMDLGLQAVDIMQSFTQMETLKKIAPVAGVLNGKLNSTIQLNGTLDAVALTPNMQSLSGDLFGQLLQTSINSKNSKLLNTLDSQFNFIDFSKLNLNDLKTALHFENGKVNIKPFDIKYQDIKMTIGGTHGFDQSMNYSVKLDVPAKYLGNEVNNLLSRLTPADAAKISAIPITATIGGTFAKPSVSTDMKSATTALAKNIAEQQKNALIGKGTNALGNLIDQNRKSGDTAKTVVPTTKEEVNQRVEEEKQKLEEKAKEEAKKKAGGLLDGLLNRKKGN